MGATVKIRNIRKSVSLRPDYRILTALVDHWRQSAGDKAMPARADLDPAGLGSVLGHAFLIDVGRKPLTFRIRLIGTKIEETFGRYQAGRLIDDPAARYFESDNLADYASTVVHERPHFTCGEAQSAAGMPINFMRILLPLSSDGVAVDMILGGVVTSTATGEANERFLESAAEVRTAIAR